MSHTYLKGLTPLRFFAAFFVIISHGQLSLSKLGCDRLKDFAIFNRGGDAVEFFYVLSGFLITFLLQKEISRTGTVSIRRFYARRVFRIWPLYFLIVAVGFLFLGVLYPRMFGQRFFDFPVWKGFVLFLLFLPNLATSLYSVGMLFPLRTIGVEEQYYLFWAPMVKLFRHRLDYLIYMFVILSYAWYYIIQEIGFAWPAWVMDFLGTQWFYAMATGGLFSLFFNRHGSAYRSSLLARPFMQWLVLALVLLYYLRGFPQMDKTLLHFGLCWLYGLLILNCSLIERPVVNLETPVLRYLGTISYTLYMCHMMVDYFLRFAVAKFRLNRINCMVMIPLYQLALIGGAIVTASLVYRYYESYFLRLKEKYAY
jgi:peptidoglycan/LPS O-acetylase OafA/YrhL